MGRSHSDLLRELRRAEIDVERSQGTKYQASYEKTLRELRETMARNDRPKASALAAEAAFFTWLGVMIVLVALSFILGGGWAVVWPLLGIGVAVLLATTVLIYASTVWVQAYRASRRTRVN